MARVQTARWAIALLVLFLPTRVEAQCDTPSHRVGRFIENTADSVYVTTSVPLNDLSPASLVCLATSLRQQYRNRTHVKVLIFDSPDAAQYYQGDVEVGDHSQGAHYRNLRALYVFNAIMQEEYLTVKPLGFLAPQPEDTRIDLPTKGAPRCKIDVDRRCLMSMDAITYPEESYSAEVTAEVMLSAIVNAEGAVANIAVISASASTGDAAPLFVSHTVRHLSSVRFEKAQRQNSLRVVYSYVLDRTLRGSRRVDYLLPDRITIRARPE